MTPPQQTRACAGPWASRIIEALAFSLPVLVTGIALQYDCLSNGGLAVLRGALGVAHLSPLTFLECFAGEVLEALLLVPAILLLAGWAAPPTARKWICFALVELILLVSGASWATYHVISQFPSSDLLMDFIATVRLHPEFVAPSALMSPRMECVFLAVLASGLAPLFILYRWPIRNLRWSHARLIVGAVLVLGTTATLLRVTGRSTAALYRMGNLERTAAGLFRSDSAPPETEAGPGESTPKRDYEEVVFPEGRPAAHRTDLLSGRPHVRPNVIFIVLETAGACDYSFAGPGSHMPNVAALAPHSLLAMRHYTSDPESIRANFSIYSSLYELPGRGRQQSFLKQLSGSRSSGPDALPRILRAQGYATRYYFPYDLWPKQFEEEALRTLGFESIHLGIDSPAEPDWNRELDRWNRMVVFAPPDKKMAAERAMYQAAIDDIAKLRADGRPFFLALAAAIGHAPFSDIRPPEQIAQSPHPGRALLVNNLAEFQDRLIGMLIRKLSELDLLRDTILVITGDHGPRTRLEDPELNLFYSSDETYHVPLLIHYPAVFGKTFPVDRVTSHVDLAPTVLDLMGIAGESYLHQGLSMFDDAIGQRITFFFGQHLLGTDALHYRGKFFMFSDTTQTSYLSDHFAFSPQDLVPDASRDSARKYREALDRMQRVQWEWIRHWRSGEVHAGGPIRGHQPVPRAHF